MPSKNRKMVNVKPIHARLVAERDRLARAQSLGLIRLPDFGHDQGIPLWYVIQRLIEFKDEHRARRPMIRFKTPIGIRSVPPDAVRRLLRKVKVEDGHWLFQGYTDRKGYGQIKIGGMAYWTHRVSYAAFNGPLEDGMQVDHKPGCRTPSCCNPLHLEQVTPKENRRRQAEANGVAPF